MSQTFMIAATCFGGALVRLILCAWLDGRKKRKADLLRQAYERGRAEHAADTARTAANAGDIVGVGLVPGENIIDLRKGSAGIWVH